jgi:hypothetical protein
MLDAWAEYHRHHTLPCSGGFLEQPLQMLITIGALELVYNTARYTADSKNDWSKLSKAERDIKVAFDG